MGSIEPKPYNKTIAKSIDPEPFEHIGLQSNFENASFGKHQIVVAILQKNELR
jgi:hypothetical protein